MWSMLIPLISGWLGENGPLGQYFKVRSETIRAEQDYKLAVLKAQAEQAVAQVEGETLQVKAKLSATTQEFKQYTFWFLCVPMLVSVLMPSYASVMWHNFEIIPEWFRTLFGAVYLTIWGIPVAANYIGGIFSGMGHSVTAAIEARREYKLNKIKIVNDKAFYDKIKSGIFKNGLTPDQVEILNSALEARDRENGS